jgi:CheY-like chemotaxis protein
MPGLDGVETARRIRADSPLKSVPAIIIITAFGREEVRGEAELAGVNGFLIKPVNQSTLVNALAEIFAPGTARMSLSQLWRAAARRRYCCVVASSQNENTL